MGKSPAKKRLTMWVDGDYVSHPLFQKLAEQGHTVVALHSPVDGTVGPHVVLSRHACRMTPDMLETKGILDLAVFMARMRKDGKDDDSALTGTDDE